MSHPGAPVRGLDLTKWPVLDREEEAEVARRYRATGSRELEGRLVGSCARIAVREARRLGPPEHRDDLASEGLVGALDAVRRFDPERGVRLATYACWWARARAFRWLDEHGGAVKLGTTEAERRVARRLRRERARLEAAGLDASDEALATALGESERDVAEVLSKAGARVSALDAESVAADGDPESEASAREARAAARALLERLLEPDRGEPEPGEGRAALERALVFERLAADEPATQADLASRAGVTRQRVTKVEAALMGKLASRARRLKVRLGEVL